ncbi:GTP 3',8-cyclase MoaA [Saccharopolyspora erythraea]|uniref:GTP 3',8-cyclase n=1 Tax=Saccharopolyspora erythraea (strain ATCC 11635 / DSM 40517 / JCM 4748 / NBRC 13426 / NCIMB 8594 / NRRL 2338) TaxID=405948 RepID=A4F790_SACEN|nr:GTP 3',8-cyclase MoaA [Saccharopolyspora erythraea]CAL99914.1 molybdenum cofactor biosynthesis protein A [Saccharopolyspora erythraea NRRL 2338]
MDLGIPVVRPTTDMSTRPDTPHLVDRFGRIARDLRVSLIDKCNLRCTYCMPAEGLPWLKRSELLDTGEMIRLIRIAVEELGVTNVRFTGGEPLLRQDLVDIISATSELPSKPKTSLTTNGINLGRYADALKRGGLNRVNVSLDTLDRDTFRELTRRDRFSDVLEGLEAAKAAGLEPVKVNTVLMRGLNGHEACDLLRYCVEHDYQLRFIEQMPLDPQHGWDRGQMITAEEILEMLGAEFDLTPHTAERGSAPAERWLVDGGPATVGVIGSVTRPFCATCDRTRLTADGQLRSCLFSTTETDLRGPMRAGAGDEEIMRLWQETMWAKKAGHGMDTEGFAQPSRPMSAIGG